MRILILHNFYQHPGGEDTVVQQEANELKKKGHEVLILTAQNRKGIKGILQFGLYPYNIIATNKLFKHINAFEPDIIHIHNLHYAIGPYLIRKLKKQGYPIVMTLHNFRLICPSATMFYRGSIHTESITENFPWTAVKAKALDHSFLKTFWVAFTVYLHKKLGTWKKIDRYLTLSEFGKQLYLRSTLDLSPHQITIKPNFTTSNPNNTLVKKKNYFTYIGRLSEEKGISTLLNSFSQSNHTIKIFGDGPLKEMVTQAAKKHQNIKYLGYHDKITLQKHLSETQGLIVPSIWFEGMPMTILEAFACGTPVIASRIGILEEMIQQGENGFLFEPHNPNNLTETLDKWHNLPNNTKTKISENCKKTYLDKYSSKENVLLLLKIYKETIK